MDKKLYIEYRVYFDPNTNQDMLHEVAEAAQETIYTLFDDLKETQDGAPSPHEVTYEVVMLIPPTTSEVN
jgi:hypothetical protein